MEKCVNCAGTGITYKYDIPDEKTANKCPVCLGQSNFDILVKAIKDREGFDYSLPGCCVGDVVAHLNSDGERSVDGIAQFLGISYSDAYYIFWAGGDSWDDNTSRATKEDAIRLIREVEQKYK